MKIIPHTTDSLYRAATLVPVDNIHGVKIARLYYSPILGYAFWHHFVHSSYCGVLPCK